MTEEQIAKLRARFVEMQFGKGYSDGWRGAFQEATWLLDEAAVEARNEQQPGNSKGNQ